MKSIRALNLLRLCTCLKLTNFLGLAITVLTSPIARAASSDMGEWSPVYPWPQVAVHLHVLPNRRILTYSDEWVQGQKVTPNTSRAYVVQIPDGGEPATTWTSVHNNTANLFCAGHAFLPDGRLLVIGGQTRSYYFGIAAATIFNHVGGYGWVTPANSAMRAPRWYPSAITLASGDILALGGSMVGQTDPNKVPEVWQTATGGWRALTTAVREVPFYPWIFPAPNGRVFLAGHKAETRYLDTAGTGKWSQLFVRKHAARYEGAAVMYDTGKIMVVGGGSPATNTAEIIDLRAAAPAWQFTGSMQFPRRYMNVTVLADGKVLATGGGGRLEQCQHGGVCSRAVGSGHGAVVDHGEHAESAALSRDRRPAAGRAGAVDRRRPPACDQRGEQSRRRDLLAALPVRRPTPAARLGPGQRRLWRAVLRRDPGCRDGDECQLDQTLFGNPHLQQ